MAQTTHALAQPNQHPKKWQRILGVFARGDTLNRFEAERIGDHALHSTVAALQGRGLILNRREETVPGFMGAPTRVCRYWLAQESVERARELLGLGNHGQNGGAQNA
ncbi:MAG: hypothetical protein K2Y31_14240 [Burkholderiales bacterium]|jgi:hypothetical protein|nr:hypothetical protein [Burkholderiales bacterium]